MKRLLQVVAGLALVIAAGAASAFADAPGGLSEPPSATFVPIFGCVNAGNGNASVPAGQPFAVRLSGWVSGTHGLVESFIPKDASTATLERPIGATPTPLPFQWQSPTQSSDGSWSVLRWSPVFMLAAGEQMRVILTIRLAQPARDLIPPSSTWDPTEAGFPPYDGTGLKYDGGLVQPFTLALPSCTITGV